MSEKLRQWLCYAELAGWVLAPVLLAALPTRVLENGPTICVYRRLTGHECPGCGMTRAFSCVAHGEFARAMAHNKLVAVALPVACCVWGWRVRHLVMKAGFWRSSWRSGMHK